MRWQLGPKVRWMQVDDGVVIFSATTDGFADLDEAGAELWLVMAAAGWSASAAADHLVDTYGMGRVEADEVVARFVASLEELGALTRQAG